MQVERIRAEGHEEVLRLRAPSAGLTGFIAVHSTRLGPAAGGLRMRPYATEAAALEDALRLSRGMSFKNAAADLPLGGGKAVIIGDPAHDKTPALLAAFGEAIEGLGGRYWTAEDMGMTPADMAQVARRTRYVAGLADGPFASGDPSPVTARGIFNAIGITLHHRYGSADCAGRVFAVQGLGHVGMRLAALLHGAGGRLVVADPDPARVARAVDRFEAEAVAPEAILTVPADLLAPCAIGGVLDTASIARLRVGAVAGGANNQLATPDDARQLQARGILYAPDFVANAGGIINVATEILHIEARESWVAAHLRAVELTLDEIFTRAATTGRNPNDLAEEIVAGRIAPVPA